MATISRTLSLPSISKCRRPACRSPLPHDGQNTFVSPYFNCTTAVNATASHPQCADQPELWRRRHQPRPAIDRDSGHRHRQPCALAVPRGRELYGERHRRQTALSSYNAPGTSLAVTLPSPSGSEAGWSMGFATDNGKGLTLDTRPSALDPGGRQDAFRGRRSAPAITNIVAAAIGWQQFPGSRSDAQHARWRMAFQPAAIFPATGCSRRARAIRRTLGDNGNVVSSLQYQRRADRHPALDDGVAVRLVDGLYRREWQEPSGRRSTARAAAICSTRTAARAQTSLNLAGNNYEFLTAAI